MPNERRLKMLVQKEWCTSTRNLTSHFLRSSTCLSAALASSKKKQYGILCRDIKPDNLLLDKNCHMKLSDFGLCKHLDCATLSTINENGAMDENTREPMDVDGSLPDAGNGCSWRSAREQLQHWQRNRRKLGLNSAYFVKCARRKWCLVSVSSLTLQM